jgi:hypothetical protein
MGDKRSRKKLRGCFGEGKTLKIDTASMTESSEDDGE